MHGGHNGGLFLASAGYAGGPLAADQRDMPRKKARAMGVISLRGGVSDPISPSFTKAIFRPDRGT